MRILPTLLTVLMATAGCNSPQDTKPEDSEPPVPLHIEAPGVDVQIGGGDGVKVDAPGTDVEVGKSQEKQ